MIPLSGKEGEKRKYCKASVRGLEAGRWESVSFSFSWPGVLTGEGETHME